MTFREFADSQDQLSTVKTAVMNSLGATDDALDDALVNFKNYRKLLNNERNPQFAKLINDASNRGAIVKAIENAAVTKISIADLISLFRVGLSGDLPGGRKSPGESEPEVPPQKPERPIDKTQKPPPGIA